MKGIIGTCVAALVLLAPVNIAAGQAGTPQRGRGAAEPPPKPAPAAAAPAAQESPGAGPIIVIETMTKGSFEFETYPNEAPRTVAHILALVKRNFYNGQRVHRVVPGFVIQFGDPTSRDMTKKDRWGTGGSGKPIGAAEMNPKRTHRLGAVAMAHAGDPKNADSQMYVTLAPTPRLDGDYTVFGQVISGMDVVQKIQVGDIIRRATVKGAAPAAKP
jgi:cyclophilin family peptidyl-prolyl cis-trans isomerase